MGRAVDLLDLLHIRWPVSPLARHNCPRATPCIVQDKPDAPILSLESRCHTKWMGCQQHKSTHPAEAHAHLSASSAPCSRSTSCSPAARAERSRDCSAAAASASSSFLRALSSVSLAFSASFERSSSDWCRWFLACSKRSSVSRSVARRLSAAAEISSECASRAWNPCAEKHPTSGV